MFALTSLFMALPAENEYTEEERQAVQALLEAQVKPQDVRWRPGPHERAPFSSNPAPPQPCPRPGHASTLNRPHPPLESIPYVTYEWAVQEANKILGQDGWSSSVLQIERDFVRPWPSHTHPLR